MRQLQYMRWMGLQIRDDARSERGASSVEYALLITLIALVCIVAVAVLGGATDESFDSNTGSLFPG